MGHVLISLDKIGLDKMGVNHAGNLSTVTVAKVYTRGLTPSHFLLAHSPTPPPHSPSSRLLESLHSILPTSAEKIKSHINLTLQVCPSSLSPSLPPFPPPLLPSLPSLLPPLPLHPSFLPPSLPPSLPPFPPFPFYWKQLSIH